MSDATESPGPPAAGTPESLANRAGQYLTFTLGGEDYGLEVLKVQEIIGMMPVTRVPQMPEYIRGVINLRGKVIPVMDLRARFALESKEDTERTCIIVVEVAGKDDKIAVGLLVDDVCEVTEITEELLEPAPSMGAGSGESFFPAMAKMGRKVVMLLDVDKIFEGCLANFSATSL